MIELTETHMRAILTFDATGDGDCLLYDGPAGELFSAYRECVDVSHVLPTITRRVNMIANALQRTAGPTIPLQAVVNEFCEEAVYAAGVVRTLRAMRTRGAAFVAETHNFDKAAARMDSMRFVMEMGEQPEAAARARAIYTALRKAMRSVYDGRVLAAMLPRPGLGR